MSDIVIKSGENSAPAIDLTKYVPKEDLEKVQTESKKTQETLKAELDQAKMSLLDPEYISYLEAKQVKLAKTPETAAGEVSDIDKMSPKQLLSVAITKAVEMVEQKSGDRFRRLEQGLGDVLGIMELQSVEKKYSDFEEYRPEIVKILEDPKSQLTIEQAYKLAKQNHSESSDAEKSSKSKPTKSPTGEKPTGSHSASEFVAKDFKDKHAASLDAWDQVVGAGKDSL